MLLVGDTTLDRFARLLETNSDEPHLRASAAPFGQVYQVLLDETHSAWDTNPEILLVWTAPDISLRSFADVLRFEPNALGDAEARVLAEVDQFADAILRASSRVQMVLIPTWILPPHERWIQTLAWRQGIGVSNLLARANLRLAEKFADQKNIVLLDAANWQASLNRPAFDLRMFAFGKILYSQAMFERVATEIKAVLRGSLGLAKKVIVCDLDNTLWGGVVGDD